MKKIVENHFKESAILPALLTSIIRYFPVHADAFNQNGGDNGKNIVLSNERARSNLIEIDRTRGERESDDSVHVCIMIGDNVHSPSLRTLRALETTAGIMS